MQNLTIAQTLTMSSCEISELVEKLHKNVIRDIWEMLEQLYGISKDGSDLSHKEN